MDIKHLQFSFRMYWANMKGLLNMVAEGIILVASLASLFILVYQFGFKYSAHVTHMLETSRVYLLLAFFTGISLRYILKFKEIIQEKMLYLDIGIYFFLFAVLSGKVFFKEAIHQSQPSLYIQINQVGPYAFDKQCHKQDVKDHPEQPVHPVFVQHVFQNELAGER